MQFIHVDLIFIEKTHNANYAGNDYRYSVGGEVDREKPSKQECHSFVWIMFERKIGEILWTIVNE